MDELDFDHHGNITFPKFRAGILRLQKSLRLTLTDSDPNFIVEEDSSTAQSSDNSTNSNNSDVVEKNEVKEKRKSKKEKRRSTHKPQIDDNDGRCMEIQIYFLFLKSDFTISVLLN